MCVHVCMCVQVLQGAGKPVVGALACFIGYYVVGLPSGAALAFGVGSVATVPPAIMSQLRSLFVFLLGVHG